MKTKIFLLAFLVISVCGFSQNITDQKTFDQNELSIIQDRSYDRLIYTDASYAVPVGAPELPTFVYRYVIPYDMKVDDITINNISTTTLAGTYNVYPKQPPLLMDSIPDTSFKGPDPIYYELTEYPAQVVNKVMEPYPFGYHIVEVKIFPVQYKPLDQLLVFNNSIDFTINLVPNPDAPQKPYRQTIKSHNMICDMLAGQVENPDSISTSGGGAINLVDNGVVSPGEINPLPSNSGIIPEHIIITSEALAGSFSALAEWKCKLGYPSVIVTKEQISQNYFGVDEAEQIRNYLKDVHQHWGPGLYILLGGDVEIIQERMVLNYGDEIRPSDFYYATTSGNWNLDRDDVFGEDEDIDDEGYDISQVFFVGRAPVNTDNEVGIFINKLIGYEQMSQLQGSELEYVNNSLEALAFLYPSLINNKLLSYNPINCFINIYNQEASNNINFYYLADRFACEEELFEYNQFEYQLCDENCPDIEPVNGDELSSESFGLTLDQGVINYPGQYFHLVYHFDHSGPWSLGTSNTMKNEALKVDRVKTLSNGNYQQVIFSSGCNSNEFHRNDCIGEEFVLNPNGGSVSYIGGTSAVPCNTYKKAGDFITTLYKYDRTNVQIGNVISESIYTDSEIEFELKKLFSLLGDPSMKIWTNTPDHMGSLGLTCASSIPIGENQMQITVSNLEYGCRGIVTIYKHQDVYAYREITGNGNAITVDFTISPNTAGSMHVTVSAFEHKPVTQSVTVTDIIDPYLYISDHDLFGWNYLKAGHEHNLKIELSNSGGQATAGNLSADIAALSLEESFENQWLPAGWDQGEVVNMEWTQHQLIDPPGIEAPSGYKFIGCNTSDGQNGEGQTLTTPSVPITTDDFSISFYMYHDDQTPNDELELWSGTSYLGSFLRNDGSIGWKHEVLQVPGLAGNEASFKFIAKGYGGNDIYIDHVKIGSAFVNLTSSTSTYDQILSEGTGWNLTDFTLNAHNNSPPNTDVIFKLTAIDQVDQSRYQDNIHFEIHPPQLEMNANYITYTSFPSNPMDSAYGSNPLSGEIVHFLVEIINNGKTKIDFDDSQMILEDATPPGEVSYIESIDYTNVSFPSADPKSISVPKNPFVIELKPIPYDNTSIKMDLTLKDVDGTEWIIPIDLYRIPRIQSDHIYTSSTFNQIKLTWDQPGSSNAGYVIYRYEETDGGSGNNEHHYIENYTRLTDFIHKYNYYIDEDVDADKIYYYKIAAIKKGGFSNPYWGAFGYWTNAVKASLQPYENGWPIHLNNKEVLGWTNKGATQTYDIDNNGDKEIFLSLGGNDEHGSIIGLNHIIEDGLTSHEVYNSDPDNYNGFVEFDCDYLSDIAFAEIVPGNDEIEIIANTNGGGTSSSDRRSVFVHSPGGFVAGEGYPPVLEWQKENAGLFSRGAVIDNIDGLGGDEILVKNEWGDQLYILNNTAPNNEFLNLSIPEAKGNGMPLILDLDNNGNKEFVYGFRDSDDFEGGVYAYDYLGNDFFTYTNTSAIPHHFDCIPAACDLNNDGEYEIILLSWVPDNKKYHVFALDRLGNEIQNWGYAGHIIDGDRNIYPAISLADLDEDGNIEVLLFTVGKLYAWKNDGTSFWPGMDYVPIEGEHADGLCPLVADIDTDDELEIIVPTNQGRIHGFNIDGTPVDLLNWPLQLGEAIKGSPCIDDVDNDGLNEIAVGALDWVHLFKTEGNANKVEWGRYRLNEKNNAVYDNRCFYDPQNPLEITGTQTWNDVIRVMDRDIVVKDGAVLTIRSKVKMPTDSKVIIERGGTLILDGGVLTSACGNIWQGVQVWGNNALSQYPFSNQGYLVMQNNAKIEDAKIAAAAIKFIGSDTDPHYAGGVIQAENSTFMNNVTGLYFHPYDNWVPELEEELENRSDFRDCNFVTNKQLNGLNLYPNAFVEMHGTEGIDFKGCEFVNARDIDIPPVSILGKGIVSTDAAYRVSFTCANEYEPCPDKNYTRFENLERGIEATDARSNLFPIIEFCEFDNNYTGVYLAATPQASVTLCKFNIRKKYTDPEADDAFTGIYVNGGCDGFRIEENEFNNPETDPLAGTPYTVGVVINNSVTYYDVNNELYNNWFGNLNFGTLAMNNNRGNNFTGLQIKCNDYDNCETDIAVTPENCDGIAAYQGSDDNSPETSANNMFTWMGPQGTPTDFNNEGELLTYYFPQNGDEYHVEPKYFYNITPTASLYIYNWNPDDGCPSNLDGSGSGGELRSEMTYFEQKADSTSTLLQQLEDGGNTDELNTNVQTSWPDEAYEIYSQLMADSPYLSDTVMVSGTQKENVLSGVMVTDILSANPQAAKSDTVMDAVNNRINQLTDEQLAEINQGLYMVGAKEALQSKTAKYKADRARALYKLLRLFREDTISPAPADSIIQILEDENQLWAKYALTFEYLKKHDSLNVVNTLDNIPSDFNLTSQQSNQHQLYEDYFDILLQLDFEDKTIFEADSSDRVELYSLYGSAKGNLKANLRNLLVNIDTLTYHEPYLFPDMNKSATVLPQEGLTNDKKNEYLLVYPNPANTYVCIEVKRNALNSKDYVSIRDVSGKEVKKLKVDGYRIKKILDGKSFKPGIYVATLFVNGNSKESVKFTVTH